MPVLRCLERLDVVRVREQARHVLAHKVDGLAGGLLDFTKAQDARLSLRIGVSLEQRRQSVREAAGTTRRVRGRGAALTTALAADADLAGRPRAVLLPPRQPRALLEPQQRQLVAQALRQLLRKIGRAEAAEEVRRLHERVQGQLRRAVAPPQREPPDGEAERPRNEAGLRWQLLHSTPHRTRERGRLYWDAIGTNGRSGHARLEEDQMPPRALRAPILDARLPPVGHPDARVEQTSAHPFARARGLRARYRADVLVGEAFSKHKRSLFSKLRAG